MTVIREKLAKDPTLGRSRAPPHAGPEHLQELRQEGACGRRVGPLTLLNLRRRCS